MRFEKYKPEHLAMIEPREYEREMRAATGMDYSETFTRGYAYTVFDDDTPVMAGGIVQLWEGVGEVWLFLSPWFERHPKTAYKIIRKLLADELWEHPFRRLQTPICSTMPSNLRLVRHLGFEYESTMRRWGPDGSDHIMMVMLGDPICLLR